jgi:hypothetical protein
MSLAAQRAGPGRGGIDGDRDRHACRAGDGTKWLAALRWEPRAAAGLRHAVPVRVAVVEGEERARVESRGRHASRACACCGEREGHGERVGARPPSALKERTGKH